MSFEDYLRKALYDPDREKFKIIQGDCSKIDDNMTGTIYYAPYKKIDVNNRLIDDESFRDMFDVIIDDNPRDIKILENVLNSQNGSTTTKLRKITECICLETQTAFRIFLNGAVKKITLKDFPTGTYALELNGHVAFEIEHDMEGDDIGDLVIDFSSDGLNHEKIYFDPYYYSLLPWKKVCNRDLVEECQDLCLNLDMINNVILRTTDRTTFRKRNNSISYKMIVERYFLEQNQLTMIKTEYILYTSHTMDVCRIGNLYAIDIRVKKGVTIKIMMDNFILGAYDIGTGHTRIKIRDTNHVYDYDIENPGINRYRLSNLQRNETLSSQCTKCIFLIFENHEELQNKFDIVIETLWLDSTQCI